MPAVDLASNFAPLSAANDPQRSERARGVLESTEIMDRLPLRTVVFVQAGLSLDHKGLGLAEKIRLILLQHGKDVFAPVGEQFEDARIAVQRIAEDDVESSRVVLQDPFEQPLRGGDFVVSRTQHLCIEQQRKVTAQEHGRHLTVVVLGLVSRAFLDAPFEIAFAPPEVGGMDLVTVDHQGGEPVSGRCQGLVAFEPSVDLTNHGAQRLGIYLIHDSPESVRAGQLGAEPVLPELLRSSGLLQGIETAGSSEEHDQNATQHGRSGNSRGEPGVRSPGQQLGEAKNLFSVCDEAPKDGQSFLCLSFCQWI